MEDDVSQPAQVIDRLVRFRMVRTSGTDSRAQEYCLTRLGRSLARDLLEDADFGSEDLCTLLNLSPCLELILPTGILIYTGGYASRGVAAWLKSAPASCRWIHFGDFDPDGLAIFDRLSAVTERDGDFFPNRETLELLKADLSAWQGARSFSENALRGDQLKTLARWGADHKLQAEQEQVLYQLRKRGVDLVALLF